MLGFGAWVVACGGGGGGGGGVFGSFGAMRKWWDGVVFGKMRLRGEDGGGGIYARGESSG